MLLRPQSDERPQSALLMGNIFYSEKQRLLAGTTNAEQVRGTVDDFGIDDFEERGVSKDHFKYLPFTNREVEDITAELGRNNWNMEDITVKKGMEASEQALKELAATGPAVIHLATHGFLWQTASRHWIFLSSRTGNRIMRCIGPEWRWPMRKQPGVERERIPEKMTGF